MKHFLCFIWILIFLNNSSRAAIALAKTKEDKTSTGDNMKIQADVLQIDNKKVTAEGHAISQIGNYTIEADKIDYDLRDKLLHLKGHVFLSDFAINNSYLAEEAFVDAESKYVFISQVRGNLSKVKIAAKSVSGNKDDFFKAEKVTASLCNVCKNGGPVTPFWTIRAKKVSADIKGKEEIKLYGVYIDVLDRQIAYLPYLSVPAFWTGGKTGFLLPTIQDKGLGYQIEIPFYLNVSKNLDFTFYPSIGQKAMYGFNMRQKMKNGGYEITVYTGRLPFLQEQVETDTEQSKKSIFRVWPANIKLQSNFFYPSRESTGSWRKAYELGTEGEFALGAEPILLYKYDLSHKKTLVGQIYGNLIHNNSFASADALHIHSLKSDTRTIALPRIHFYNIVTGTTLPNDLIFSNATIVTHLSTNNLQNENFSSKTSDVLGEVRLVKKSYLRGANKITYAINLAAYKAIASQGLQRHRAQTSLDIHYQSKLHYNRTIIEPHAVLHLQKSVNSLHMIDTEGFDDDQLSIYSTSNNVNPNNIFADSLYSTGMRSIMRKNANNIDYGFVVARYGNRLPIKDKFLWVFASRQYLSPPSRFREIAEDTQDFVLARLQDKYKEKYVSQLTFEKENFFLSNRTWFTKNVNLINNEFYMDKKFLKLSTGLEFLFFNEKFSFDELIPQKKYNKIIKTKVKYLITENLGIEIKNGIKSGKNAKNAPISQMQSLKMKIEYKNECINLGFAMKKEFDKKGKANDNVNSYTLYLKIPSI